MFIFCIFGSEINIIIIIIINQSTATNTYQEDQTTKNSYQYNNINKQQQMLVNIKPGQLHWVWA